MKCSREKKMNAEQPIRNKKRKGLIIFLSIIAVLIILRLLLPFVILKYVNTKLAGLEEYTGHVEDIDLAIIRGAYQINSIRIDKKDKASQKLDSIPFFLARRIDLALSWKALFKGKVVGTIEVDEPVLNFVKGKEDGEAKKDTDDFKKVIKDLLPLTIDHFRINDGLMRYVDRYSSPNVDVALQNIQVEANNLSNVNDSGVVLPASLKARAEAYEGQINLNVKFDALKKQPTFDLNARVKDVNMVMLNDFFKAYANFDVKKGSLGLYTEFAAKEGNFAGYVKPFIRDLDVLQWNKEEGDLKQKLWESVVGAVAEIFQNQKKEQLATKLPIEGRFDNPDTGLWTAINYLLRNAFITALKPSVDKTINLGAVEAGTIPEKKTFLQKVFGKGDKKEK